MFSITACSENATQNISLMPFDLSSSYSIMAKLDTENKTLDHITEVRIRNSSEKCMDKSCSKYGILRALHNSCYG